MDNLDKLLHGFQLIFIVGSIRTALFRLSFHEPV